MLCWQGLTGPYQGDPSFQHKALKGQTVQPNRTALLFIYHFQDTSTLQVMLLGAHSRPSGIRFYTKLCCSASVGTTPATNDVLSVRTQVSNISAVHKAVNVFKSWVCWKAEREMPEAVISSLCPHLFLDIWANVLKALLPPKSLQNQQAVEHRKAVNQGKMGLMRSLSKHPVMSRQPKLKHYINSIAKFSPDNFGGRPVSSVG